MTIALIIIAIIVVVLILFFVVGFNKLRKADINAQEALGGIDVQLTMNRPSDVWTFPIETVSQSEGGFELVHQSVMVQPHWVVRGDASGRWR